MYPGVSSVDHSESKRIVVDELLKARPIFDSLHNCITIFDAAVPGTPLIYCNPAYERITGYSAEELLGRSWWLLESAIVNQCGCTELRSAIRDGHSAQVLLKNHRKDGSSFWNEVYASPIFDSNGNLSHYLTFQNDVTVRVEGELRFEREAQQKSIEAGLILQTAGDGIYGVDANGLLTFANPAAESMSGWKAEELLGKSQHAIIHHSHFDGTAYPSEECPIYMALRDGLIHRSENEVFWRRDGSSFPVEYTSTPLIRNGRIDGAVILFQDITERKRRQQESTAAGQAKSDFLSNMSHEIRTPMNGILGMLQLMLAGQLEDEQRQFAEVAESSGRTLLSLIDGILDFSKIEAGKMVIEKLEFNLGRMLDDITEMWRIQANTKGLAFATHLSPDIPVSVCGDPTRMRQVLNNLISNALKFTEAGSLSVHSEVVSRNAEKLLVRLSITDTGIGMCPEQAQQLFQPFVQADISTTRKYGGSGLGLSICMHLVSSMGGDMGVESQPGVGSTFWFTLPLDVPVSIAASALDHKTEPLLGAKASPDQSTISVLKSEAIPSMHHERILVVEDNLTNRLVVMAQLKKLGYEAFAVEDGAKAVKAMEDGGFDLILMDCEMPVLDGYEATRSIRQSGNTDVPIIALSAHAMSSNRETCLAAGMNYFLSKPLDIKRLSRILREWCHKSERQDLRETDVDSFPISATEDFEESSFLQRLMDDHDLAQLILRAFLEDCPRQLEAIKLCFAEKDGIDLRSTAHTLKGSASAVSAVHLTMLAKQLEEGAARGELKDSLLSRIVEAFERFKVALQYQGWLQQ